MIRLIAPKRHSSHLPVQGTQQKPLPTAWPGGNAASDFAGREEARRERRERARGLRGDQVGREGGTVRASASERGCHPLPLSEPLAFFQGKHG